MNASFDLVFNSSLILNQLERFQPWLHINWDKWKVWLQTKRNPVMSPHWCECWVLLISLVISVVWPSSVRVLDSLFFVFLLSFLSFFYLVIFQFLLSSLVTPLFCSLCLYVLSSPWIFVCSHRCVYCLWRTFTNLLSFPQHTTRDDIRYGKITTTIFV